VALLIAGCAHSGFRYPGPLGSVGRPFLAPEDGLQDGPGSVWDGIEPGEEQPATGSSGQEGAPEPGARERQTGAAVARAASHFIGTSRLRHGGDSFRYDCSGLVMAAHARAGLALVGSSESLLQDARRIGVFHRRKRPWVGDVAFFENTYDRNGNGRLDDPITHVAVVVSVAADGTVGMVHKGSKGIAPLVMNLEHPKDRSDEEQKELNDYLRARRSGDRSGTRYLAGELWIGFGSFWRVLGAD